MIEYPYNWEVLGQPISLKKIESVIITSLEQINCNYLAFSGGIDSSLLLYYMSKMFNKIHAFTIGLKNHPDIIYAKKIVKLFKNVKHYIFIPTEKEILNATEKNDYKGDNAVRLLYKYVYKYNNCIVAGDGIDEFACGYYEHQRHLTEEIYYKYLRKLQKEQLKPLDKNSGKIKIYLPYLSTRLVSLMSQIPLRDKVNVKNRKQIIVDLAKDKIPKEIINRWKYGFCHALSIKNKEKLNGN